MLCSNQLFLNSHHVRGDLAACVTVSLAVEAVHLLKGKTPLGLAREKKL